MFVLATILFVLTAFIGLFLAIIHPLLAIFDCATSRQLSGAAKATWIVVTLFFGALGSMAYGFLGGSSPWFRRTSMYSLLLAIGGLALTALAVSQSPEIKQNFLVAMGEADLEVSTDDEQSDDAEQEGVEQVDVEQDDELNSRVEFEEIVENELIVDGGQFIATEQAQLVTDEVSNGVSEDFVGIMQCPADSEPVADSSAEADGIGLSWSAANVSETNDAEPFDVADDDVADDIVAEAISDDDDSSAESQPSFVDWLGQAASAIADSTTNLPAPTVVQTTPPVDSKQVFAKTRSNESLQPPATAVEVVSPSDKVTASQRTRRLFNRYTSSSLPVESAAQQGKVVNRYLEIYPPLPTAVESPSPVRNRYTGQ